MDSSGLPIPTGGSEPLSAVLLELSSRGLRLTTAPLSSQTRDTSFSSPVGDHRIGNPGEASSSTHLQNQTTSFDQQKNIYQNDCQLLLNSVKISFDKKQRVSKLPQISPVAAQAHMNLQRKMKQEAITEKSGLNSAYKLGKGAERLKEYISQLKNRPKDHNIQFWRDFVAEFFAPGAKKKWCVSSYKNIKQIHTFFKVVWQCDMCNMKPCCGFEINEELLPRLLKIRYENGILEEHLHIDMPNEYQGACGQIFLHYSKAAEESEYEQVRILRYGQLRVVFSSDLKICSWEFCAQCHEEYICRNSLIPQVCQLGAAMRNYQLSTQDSSSRTPEELQNRTDMFISSAYQMVEALGMPFISQIGIVKRYVRCLQIAEVLNIMHDLIDYSQENGLTATESIAKFPRFGSNVSPGKNCYQQPQQQRPPAAFSIAATSARGFFGHGLGNTAGLTSMGPNNNRKQFTGLISAHETPAQITPVALIHSQPQRTHIALLEKSGTESAARNIYKEPKTSHSNLADPNNSLSTVERIIQGVITAQQYSEAGAITGQSYTEDKIGIMPTGSNALGNISNGGNSVASNGITSMDVENYELEKNGTGFSTPTIGMTSTAEMNMDTDIFPTDAKGNYLPQEYDEQPLEEFVNFESLYELLK